MVEKSASHQLYRIAFWIGDLRLSSDVFVQADVATDGWQGLGEGLSNFVIILKLKWNMILETACSMQKIYLLVISIFSIIPILFGTAAADICSIEITALRARDDGCDQCGLTVGTMARSWVCNTPSKRKFHVTELEVGIRFVSWAMKKRAPWWFSVYMGDEIVPSCVGNHYVCIYKDPY